MIIGGAMYFDVQLKLNLQDFDLNGDGLFTGKEITEEQTMALYKVSNDVARHFSFITGIIISAILTVCLLGLRSLIICLNRKRKKYLRIP